MSNRSAALFVLLLLIGGSALYAGEKTEMHLDGRAWKLGWSADEPHMKMREYVLEGQTVENWQELVTLQFFPGLQQKATPEQMQQSTKEGLSKQCPEVAWMPLEQKSDDVLYQWSIRNCPGQADQTEITRIVAGKEGMHVWHYAVKSNPIDAAKREQWIQLLKAFKLIP